MSGDEPADVDRLVLQAATEARAHAARAIELADAQVAELAAEASTLRETVEAVEGARARARAEHDQARLETARRMGYRYAVGPDALPDPELLLLLPDALPTGTGALEWDRWRQSLPAGAVEQRWVDPRSWVEAVRISAKTPSSSLFNADALVASLFTRRG